MTGQDGIPKKRSKMPPGTPPKPSRALVPTACSGEERGGSPGLIVSCVASKDECGMGAGAGDPEYLRICQLKTSTHPLEMDL